MYRLTLIQHIPCENANITLTERSEFVFDDYRDVITFMTMALENSKHTLTVEVEGINNGENV